MDEKTAISTRSQVRLGNVILTGFNLLCAVSTAVQIVYAARKQHQRGLAVRFMDEKGERREERGGLESGAQAPSSRWDDNDEPRGQLRKWMAAWSVPAGDVFPLLLALAVVAQGVVFLLTEMRGIDGKKIAEGCNSTAGPAWAGE